MARDGPGFFQGDGDWDLLSYVRGMENFEGMTDDDEARAQRLKELNDGEFTDVFDELYQEYREYKASKSMWNEDGERALVLFCIVAMELGVIFTKKQLYLLRSVARDLPTVFEQMLVVAAADEYNNNGTLWVMESPVDYPHVQSSGRHWDSDFLDPFVYLSGPG